MKAVLRVARRRHVRRHELVEIVERRKARGIDVRNLAIPEVEFVGPGAQPIILTERCSGTVGVGVARRGIDAGTWADAQRIETGGRVKDTHDPAARGWWVVPAAATTSA